jgi:putative transposase
MPKRATKVVLNEKEQEALTRISRRYRSEQQVAQRARIVLAAAQGHSNAQIAGELDINVDTLSISERLQDAPRPGKTPQITMEQRCQMAALACEAPSKAGRPISQWTGREIADEVMARGIIQQISPRHAARLLKKGGSNRTASATGLRQSLMSGGTRKLSRGASSTRRPPNGPSEENASSARMS